MARRERATSNIHLKADQRIQSPVRVWIATAAVILLVIAVWKFIDWRMQPPPPPPEEIEATP